MLSRLMTAPEMSWQEASKIAPILSAIVLIINVIQLNSAYSRLQIQKKLNMIQIIAIYQKARIIIYKPYSYFQKKSPSKEKVINFSQICVYKRNRLKVIYFETCMSFYLFHKEQTVKSQNLIAYYKFTKVTTNIHQLFQEHHILIKKFIQDRFKMNVRNLKEMFEQKGTIKPKIQNNQAPIIIPKPLVVNDMPITQICEEKINAPQPKTTTKTTINKSFLQQLNKKLDNKNTNISPVRMGGLSYLQPRQAMTEPVKVQNELKIEDIITGIASKKQTSQTSKARYAINESNALASEQKSIFKDLGSIEVENNTVSFQELLVKAIKNINLLPNQEQEVKKNNESRKTIISNKYEYGQEKLTRQQKLKRIDFVLKVVFAENQYEIVPSNNKQQSNKMSPVRVSESKKQLIVQNQQWKKPNSQILENNRTPVVASTASTIMPERMKSVSNPFLEELKKIQKKQTLTISNSKQIVINNTPQIQELKSETIEVIQKIDEQSLALRQKKKQKKLQNFDDL